MTRKPETTEFVKGPSTISDSCVICAFWIGLAVGIAIAVLVN